MESEKGGIELSVERRVREREVRGERRGRDEREEASAQRAGGGEW